jgi:putative restriction endonuclease
MNSATEVLAAFERIRRAQTDGRYAPHKPLLLLLSLARVQRNETRLMTLAEIEPALKGLLQAFAPSSSVASRHYPFWHLRGDAGRRLWEVEGPPALVARPDGATPNLSELRQSGVRAGFPEPMFQRLTTTPSLVREAALAVLDACFPATLHDDIACAVGLDLATALEARTDITTYAVTSPLRRRRDPAFRERVLRAYEYRCCVCGFDLRVGHAPVGLEAAHIQWHHIGGPDEEPNGLALCALHHKLFDLGAFTIEPSEHRIVFSQHAIAGTRGHTGELQHHGKPILPPQHANFRPGQIFLDWNLRNVFKAPARA